MSRKYSISSAGVSGITRDYDKQKQQPYKIRTKQREIKQQFYTISKTQFLQIETKLPAEESGGAPFLHGLGVQILPGLQHLSQAAFGTRASRCDRSVAGRASLLGPSFSRKANLKPVSFEKLIDG